jgi:NAD(P)-dependent dehydrogenase (short-subunit alcohol dehydrogenase family)
MWTVEQIPDQRGRVVLVTGANSGLGLESTRALVARGAHVIMACRDVAKAEAATRGIVRGPGGQTEIVPLDLSSLASVRALVEAVAGRRIDVLVDNAGVMAVPRGTSIDGHELHWATNVLGPFALTAGLLGQVTDRVVWVSSIMHRLGRIDLADPDFRTRRYNRWTAYGQSKLADLMLAYELQRRLELAGSPVRSYAAHPGYARTQLQRHTPAMRLPYVDRIEGLLRMSQDAAGGAQPVLMAATDPDLRAGSYVGPSGRGELTGPPRVVGSTAASYDRAVQARLWELCERETGVSAGLPG